MTVTFGKSDGSQIIVIIGKDTAEKIIDVIYPNPGIRGVSKGYIELVNFIMKEVK